jgi:hypothetical protein
MKKFLFVMVVSIFMVTGLVACSQEGDNSASGSETADVQTEQAEVADTDYFSFRTAPIRV